MTRIYGLVVLIPFLLCSSAYSQGSPAFPVIEPAEVLLPIGQSQTFQLLNTDGTEQKAQDWSISAPEVVGLEVEQGHAIVTGRSVGVATLFNGSGAPAAEIHVHDGAPPMPADARWILRPIDGAFVHALWASGTWGGSTVDADLLEKNHPSYFYQDWGMDSAHVRAISDNGLQVWQWPATRSSEVPRMICGDTYGGVLVYEGDQAKRVLVDLDALGRERWRVAAPGFDGRSFTYTMIGILYIVEEDADGNGGRIVGLDAKTGKQKFLLELPRSQDTLHNLATENGKVFCAPGVENTTPLPLRHSKMMSNTQNVADLAYSEYHFVANGGSCKAGSPADLRSVSIKVTQRLVMVDIKADLTSTSTTIEGFAEEGPASDTWVDAVGPTGDIIVGEKGTGNFLAVRRTHQLWRPTGPGTIAEFQYRITDDRKVSYRVPVPVSPLGFPTSMLLGENFGYTTRGPVVIAFELDSGHEAWRYEGTDYLLACIALKGDQVLVHEGDGYTIVADGRAIDHRTEEYMFFVAKFRPDPLSF